MEKVGILFSHNFWKSFFPFRCLWSNIKLFVSIAFGLQGMVVIFREDFFLNNISHYWAGVCFVLLIAIMVKTLVDLFNKTKGHYKFKNSDVYLGYCVGDILNLEGAKVVSVNTDLHVKTEADGGFISIKSLQGKVQKKYYDNYEHLEHDIAKSLSKFNLVKPVSVGTVIPVMKDKQVLYLVALTQLNNHGKVNNCTFNNIQACLNGLWQHVGEYGEFGEIVIPLLGTGMARKNVNRIEIAQEIIRSFSAALSTGTKLCEKLTICISYKDFIKYKVDILELDEFIKYTCKYTKFNERDGNPSGMSLELEAAPRKSCQPAS